MTGRIKQVLVSPIVIAEVPKWALASLETGRGWNGVPLDAEVVAVTEDVASGDYVITWRDESFPVVLSGEAIPRIDAQPMVYNVSNDLALRDLRKRARAEQAAGK